MTASKNLEDGDRSRDMQKMPQARKSGLIVKEVDSEVLIYDQERNKAHCLNQTAAKVWKHCDGKTTVTQACNSLSRDFDNPVDDKLIWYAIQQFSRDHLLEDKIEMPPFMIAGMNRRQMVRTLGLAAVIALPLVTTIVAPTPAQAASQLPPGSPCTSPSECQSGICCTSPGVCPPANPIGTCF
jgi:hypothetical protein